MQLFVQSNYCQSRTRCGTCRDRGDAGAVWRQTMSRMYELPPQTGEGQWFACPFGVGETTAGATAPAASRGLGDTVAKVAHAVGIDKIAKAYTAVTGRRCGCAERRDRLNQIVPYR